MKAIILAAGVGRRLQILMQERPKCLIEFGGRSLLFRYFDSLETVGITKVVLVVGYKQNLIRQAVMLYGGQLDVTFLVNNDFERGSIGSLWAARQELNDDVVIMDADVLFHPVILKRLVDSIYPNALLMDETVIQEIEECMVIVRHGRVAALTKKVPDHYDLAGEGVGFLKVVQSDLRILLQSIERRIDEGLLDLEYEDALEDFFGETVVGFEKIGGVPWIEIDFPDDVRRAQNHVLPKLKENVLD